MKLLIIFCVLCLSFNIFADDNGNHLTIVAVENVEKSALLYQKISVAYKKLGYTLDLVQMPSKRAFVEAQKSSGIDADLVRAIEAEKVLTNYIRIPVPIVYAEIKAYMSEEHNEIHGWHSLVDYKTVSLHGILATTVRLNQYNVPFMRVSTPQQALDMVKAKRVDVAVIVAEVIENKDNILMLQQYFPYTKVLEKKPFFHFIHKKHEALVPALTEEFKRIFKS